MCPSAWSPLPLGNEGWRHVTREDHETLQVGRGTPESVRSPYLDAGLLVAAASAGMYVLGWTYWQAFFEEFGVHFSFIDFPFERLVATTWWLLFWLIWGIDRLFDLSDAERIGAVNVRLPVDSLTTLLLALTVVSLALIIRPAWWIVLVVCLAAVAVLATIGTLFDKKSLPIGQIVAGSRYRLMLSLIIVFCLSVGAYSFAGTRAARALKSKGHPRVEVRLMNSDEPTVKGTFIAHMRDKYFVWCQSPSDGKARARIIHDSAVSSVEVW